MASATNAYKHDKALQAAHQQQLKALLRAPGNESCADCGGRFPRFASVSLGVFLCNRCYGIHRGIGVHVTRTKCVDLDTWSDREVAAMRAMGNRRAAAIWQGTLPAGVRAPTSASSDAEVERWIRDKYEHRLFHNPAAAATAAAAAAASATAAPSPPAAAPASASPPSTTPSTPWSAFPHGPTASPSHCTPACPPQLISTPPPGVAWPTSGASGSSTGGTAHARQGVDALSSASLICPRPATTTGSAAHLEQPTLTAARVPAGHTGHAAVDGSGSSSISNALSVSGTGSSSSMSVGPSLPIIVDSIQAHYKSKRREDFTRIKPPPAACAPRHGELLLHAAAVAQKAPAFAAAVSSAPASARRAANPQRSPASRAGAHPGPPAGGTARVAEATRCGCPALALLLAEPSPLALSAPTPSALPTPCLPPPSLLPAPPLRSRCTSHRTHLTSFDLPPAPILAPLR
ncbi:unnamed protein product [Closterium sp. Yama58-4]|nr:unnamed protein product [Closterium sp. Yama58-4]